MFSVAQLEELIRECQNLKPVFSSQLSPETVALMQEESDFTCSYFTELATSIETGQDVTSTKSAIKSFFKDRWSAIRKTNSAYTRHPFLPVNQLCLKIAEAIAEPDEPVCQLLMSTIKGMCRKSYSLKSESEEKGHFYLEHFILNKDQTLLIPVEEIFIAAATNTNAVFPDFQEDLSSLQYQLKGRDFLNLEQLTGEASATYLQTLKKHHAQHYKNNSIGFAIKSLATEVKKGSVRDSGTESYADNEVVAKAIKRFYDLWRSLPEETKNKVRAFELQEYANPHISLECYFLALFVRHPECPLSDEEWQQHQAAKIYPCAFQITEVLDEFLIQYPELYTIMIHAQEVTEELPALEPLLAQAIAALKKRQQALDGDDQAFWVTLPQFMGQQHAAARLAPHVSSYQDLIAILPNSVLLQEIISLVQSRLGQLNNVWRIHKLFPYLSAENQQLIIDAKLEELFRELGYSFDEFANTLKPQVKEQFESLYLRRLAKDISSFTELQQALSQLKNKKRDHQFLAILLPKLQALFSDQNILSIWADCSDEAQILLSDRLSDQFIQGINPDNVITITRPLKEKAGAHFISILAKKIASQVSSLAECLTVLTRWKGYMTLQKGILNELLSQSVLNSWVTDGEGLLSVMHVLAVKENRYDLFLHYPTLITDKTLGIACLNLMPETRRQEYLSALVFDPMVTNLADLLEVTALVRPGRERSIIFAQFNKEKLNCTQEEFDELTKPLVKRLEVKKAMHQLESIAAGYQTSERHQMPEETRLDTLLLRCLQNTSTTDEEKIAYLKSTKNTLSQPLHRSLISRSPGFVVNPKDKQTFITIIDAIVAAYSQEEPKESVSPPAQPPQRYDRNVIIRHLENYGAHTRGSRHLPLVAKLQQSNGTDQEIELILQLAKKKLEGEYSVTNVFFGGQVRSSILYQLINKILSLPAIDSFHASMSLS